jgi:UDP-N-acetylmuramate--alanine ligase
MESATKGVQKVHLIGVGGIGLSGLAQYYGSCGIAVSGSDRDPNPAVHDMLESAGVTVAVGHLPANVPEDVDLVVYSDAIVPGSKGYVEREAAEARGVRVLSYFEALGEVSKGAFTIAVAGTHGKTTTTAMLVKILVDAGLQPTAIVGSIMNDFKSNFVVGDPNLFVVEACEYKDHLLKLAPNILVITNLELDHTDWFPDLAAVQKTFARAIAALPEDGVLVTDPHDANIAPLLNGASVAVEDYTAIELGEVPQTGFNRLNAQAAGMAARAYARAAHTTITDEPFAKSLSTFTGTWRRFEQKGVTKRGALVYDDYAHHPTAISKTIELARERFPDREIVVLFHPHLYSRTQSLFSEFAEALSTADRAYVLPIYPAREQASEYPGVTSHALAKAISGIAGNGTYVSSFEDAEKLARTFDDNVLLLTMGAGDVYKVGEAVILN